MFLISICRACSVKRRNEKVSALAGPSNMTQLLISTVTKQETGMSGANRTMSELDARTRTDIEAAAFRRLLSHLRNLLSRTQNIDLMILAGFCRNCLADWSREAAAGTRGRNLERRCARNDLRYAVFRIQSEAPQGSDARASGGVRRRRTKTAADHPASRPLAVLPADANRRFCFTSQMNRRDDGRDAGFRD
ncbi:MAG: DUF1244 domain-containing protein [Parvularculaceae bacterium]